MQRPTWLPSYLPELDGLRGLAILAVVLYHCDPLLKGTWIHYAAQWGWAGVILFFVLSGFLITANLLGARDKPHYFHNFHARRALRIWPVYLLVLAVVYLNAPWFIGPSVWGAIKAAPWLAYIFFVQNLFHLARCLRPRSHLGAGCRRAVLLCLGAAGALAAPAVDAGERSHGGAGLLAAGAPPEPRLDVGIAKRTRLSSWTASRWAAAWRWEFTRSDLANAFGSGSAWERLRWELPPRPPSPAEPPFLIQRSLWALPARCWH
jgi:hypothetical protein